MPISRMACVRRFPRPRSCLKICARKNRVIANTLRNFPDTFWRAYSAGAARGRGRDSYNDALFWLTRPLKISDVRKQAQIMELETRQFYQKAISQVTDAEIRKLLGDLEEAERKHRVAAEALGEEITQDDKKSEEDAQRRLFVLQIVQLGLAGLMDGSVSTLAPVFAAAFATREQQRCFSGRACGIYWRGHFNGVCRGALRRRLADRAREACAARRSYRIDDRRGRHWAYATVFVPNFHAAFVRGGDRGWVRVRSNCVDSKSLYGYAAAVGSFSVVVGGVLVFIAGIWIGSS